MKGAEVLRIWRTPDVLRKARTCVLVISPFLLINSILLQHIDHVPFSDGRWNFNILLQAVQQPFALSNFSFVGHTSHLFAMIFSFGQYIHPGSSIFLTGTGVVLGNFALLAFIFILRKIFPGASLVERTLMACVYASLPVIAATTINFAPDFGVLVFFLITLACLLYERYVLAALGGFAMMFCKETGIPIYGITVVLYVLQYFFASRSSRPSSVRQSARIAAQLSLAFIPMALYAIKRHFIDSSTVFWQDPHFLWRETGLLKLLFHFDFYDPHLVSGLVDFFVLNFLWIGSVFIILAAVRFVCCPRHSKNSSGYESFIVVLLSLFVLFATRYLPFNHVRYFLVGYPLVLTTIFLSVRFLCESARIRYTIFLVLLILFFYSLHHSDDPVSDKVFGSFPFGTEKMYHMGRINRDGCCGLGLDQLVYNLQFTNLVTLQERALGVIHPTDTTVIVDAFESMPVLGLRDRWNPATRSRELLGNGILPRYMTVQEFAQLSKIPPEAYVIAYPNFARDTEAILFALRKHYRREHITDVHGSQGHSIRVHAFTNLSATVDSVNM